MARGRVGALSRSTFFPGTGDQLENPSDGITWECVRSNKFVDANGETISYGLLRGRTPEFKSDMWAPISSVERNWLDGVTTIQRALSTEPPSFRTYVFSEETGTWRQVRK
jgi:hypothetical protein